MRNANFMYFRPGNLYKEFTVEVNKQTVTSNGRAANCYVGDGTETLKGCLAEASPDTKEMWGQLGHTVSHTIVQTGVAKAKPGDRLVLGDRIFYIEGMDNAGDLSIATMYHVREVTGNGR